MKGAVESLNVSVASGVCLYEAVRQRSAAASSSSPPRGNG
jgi:23S rRNA (guanosine2251-2'-O)-methyltransferase